MKNNKNYTKVITISNLQEGQRIDNFLINHLKNIPKSAIYRMLRKKIIKINKKRTKPFYKIINKDKITIPYLQIKNNIKTHSLGKIKHLINDIIYEDDSIIAINKPAGTAVHGGSGISCGVIEGLRILRPELKFLELVHRLDRDTSGILLMAKKCSVLRCLNMQLFKKKIKKKYIALVHGKWPNNITKVTAPLMKKNNKIVYVNTLGKASETRFNIEKKYDDEDFTLMKVTPITGRTHQIRVHALHVGHPIVCDNKYGYQKLDKKIILFHIDRLFLHASSLTFMHPHTKKTIQIQAPIEKIFKNFLDKLNKKYISNLVV